jgi:hypothetical protein
VQQKAVGSTEARLGTGVTLALRNAGVPPSQALELTLTGPSGWNDEESIKLSYPAGAEWIVQPLFGASPLAGQYTVTGTVAGQAVQARFTLVDAAQTLPLLEGSFKRTNTALELSWNAVSGAKSYLGQLTDATEDTVVAEGYTLESRLILNPPMLNPAHSYYAVLYAANFDTTSANPTWPVQLQISDSLVGLSLNSLSGPQGSRFARGGWVKR